MFIRKISRKVHVYMIGKLQNTITVQQLYEYALLHNYLNANVSVVLDIMNKEKSNSYHTISSIHNTYTTDFSTLVEYSIEDLINLFNT